MSQSPKPESGKPRGFRELAMFLGVIAVVLLGLAALRPSAPQPNVKAPEITKAASAQPKEASLPPPKAAAPAAKAEETKIVSAPPAASAPARTEPVKPASQPAVADKTDAAAGRPTQLARQGQVTGQAIPDRAAPVERATMKIQSIKSKTGIEAWLVEEHSVPLLAMRFVFEGGNSQDPVGKEGVSNFLTAMMDEGAGEYDHSKFQERMEELAFRMSFDDARDAFFGNFETLTANRAPSVEMLRLAINKPRFEAAAVERVKGQLLANLAFAAKKPDQIASKAWSATAFPGHPYGRPANGTPESVASITRDDLETLRKRTFARDTLRVVAVGDITASELSELLDKVFGDLPAKAELTPVAAVKPATNEKLKVIEMDVPQSVVQFGMNGIARKDPDFLPAFILNQILGGGGFASRLTEEVREKRGLAYSVYSYLQPYKHVAIFGGGVATKNEEVAQSIDVIRAELKRMADEGPTPTEVANAKSYLTGSFALRFDTNAKIASQLLWMLQEEMGIDYVEKRNALVEAVTIADLQRVAKRLLAIDELIITVVGKPKGLGQRS